MVWVGIFFHNQTNKFVIKKKCALSKIYLGYRTSLVTLLFKTKLNIKDWFISIILMSHDLSQSIRIGSLDQIQTERETGYSLNVQTLYEYRILIETCQLPAGLPVF